MSSNISACGEQFPKPANSLSDAKGLEHSLPPFSELLESIHEGENREWEPLGSRMTSGSTSRMFSVSENQTLVNARLPVHPGSQCIPSTKTFDPLLSNIPSFTCQVHERDIAGNPLFSGVSRTSFSSWTIEQRKARKLHWSTSSREQQYCPPTIYHHHHQPPGTSTSHQPKRQYGCNKCSKAFSCRSMLSQHTHSHAGERPYRCRHAGCMRRYSWRSNVIRHEKNCKFRAVAGLNRSPMPEMGAEQTPASAAPKPNTADAEGGDDVEINDDKGHVMDFSLVSSIPVPTFEGFRAQIMQLNPRLETSLIHRFAQAQVHRYKHLVELQRKHLDAVANRSCKAGKFCFALRGDASLPQERKVLADTEAGNPQILVADYSIGRIQSCSPGEGAISAAQYPPGVPLPPVSRLPAEFECPICFEVKKFQKPYDWTIHVHKDVQPFTCSFPECDKPKSFKRKADWVRHENERHRQLEWWTCSYPGCSHTCFRKGDFVQHLVREHNMSEPKAKRTKGWAEDASSDSMSEREFGLWRTVDHCSHETEDTLCKERCRFCGYICASWKRLMVHLGKHMEHLAMPVLELAKQSCSSPNQVLSSSVTAAAPR